MTFGLFTVKESPRWLASRGRISEALANLAYMRKESPDSESIREEMAEIEAQINEEREARVGLGLKEAFFGKGNFIRFFIAFVIFLLQQWCGQNSVNYYAPRIFQSVSWYNPHFLGYADIDSDRLHGNFQLAACVRNLRHRQVGSNNNLRIHNGRNCRT